MEPTIKTPEELNTMADTLLRTGQIHTDHRNETDNTRKTVVIVKENEEYVLIEKQNGQTTQIRHYQNVISALLQLPKGNRYLRPLLY